jgi:type VI secretion system protein ImpL
MSDVRVAFDASSSPAGNLLHYSGPWALFRLFDGRLQQSGSSDKYTLTLVSGGHQALFEIRAGSVQNPFAPGLLRNFQCPKL